MHFSCKCNVSKILAPSSYSEIRDEIKYMHVCMLPLAGRVRTLCNLRHQCLPYDRQMNFPLDNLSDRINTLNWQWRSGAVSRRGICLIWFRGQHPDKNFFTWRHPRSTHSHLLDHVVTRKTCIPEILSTKAMRGAECSTDHYMVRSQLRLQLIFPRWKDPSKTPSKKLNIGKLKSEERQQALAAAITATATTWWKDEDLQQTPEWNSAATNIALREIKAKLQREIRAKKDKWWNEKAEELQEMADKNDSHGLFEGLKAIYGPRCNAVAPVKSADGSQLHTDL